MNPKSKGTRKEYKSRRLLETAGYAVTRAAGSHGAWNLIGIGPTDVVLCQVKSNRGPAPAEREAFKLVSLPGGLQAAGARVARSPAPAGGAGAVGMARVLSLTNVAAVPTLDELAADPTRASSLPTAALQSLLCRCLTLQTALMRALLTASARTADIPSEPDSLLDVAAAATRLGASRDWLYHHARQLPFTVRNGRLLRFSSHGIDRYIKNRQARLPG